MLDAGFYCKIGCGPNAPLALSEDLMLGLSDVQRPSDDGSATDGGPMMLVCWMSDHEMHETCHSVTFYFMSEQIF